MHIYFSFWLYLSLEDRFFLFLCASLVTICNSDVAKVKKNPEGLDKSYCKAL